MKCSQCDQPCGPTGVCGRCTLERMNKARLEKEKDQFQVCRSKDCGNPVLSYSTEGTSLALSRDGFCLSCVGIILTLVDLLRSHPIQKSLPPGSAFPCYTLFESNGTWIQFSAAPPVVNWEEGNARNDGGYEKIISNVEIILQLQKVHSALYTFHPGFKFQGEIPSNG